MTGLSEKDRALVERHVGPFFANDPPSWLAPLLQAARSEGQGEPVAWLLRRPDGFIKLDWPDGVGAPFLDEEDYAAGWTAKPLYASPPDPQARIEALEEALRDIQAELRGTVPTGLALAIARSYATLNPQATDQAATKGGDHGGK